SRQWSTGLANDPKITGATAAGELQKLPAEYRLHKDDQFCNSKREFESSHFNPSNERSPVQDATKSCQILVDGITQPKENHKSFPMVAMNEISHKISDKLQLRGSNSGPGSDRCGDPEDSWAGCLLFLQLANERAGKDSNLNQ
ncbi:hypothetical protein DSO57_1013336, partial [Entomophthora muscae]